MDAEAGEPAPAPEPAAGPGAERQARRGPAPIASFDHDGSDESSPESKQAFRLPEIREHEAGAAGAAGAADARGEGVSAGAGGEGAGSRLAAPGEGRARSHSTPAVAPRIDISRASSSSHHDSRDSSPELALFAGDAPDDRGQRLELGFREDGALDLRSSTEELSFLEQAPAPRFGPALPPAPPPSQPPAPAPPSDRRHSRKDSQSSEAALLVVSGRTSRLSSVGSACSAQSGVSRLSRLSVVSGVSRSPSPHRMLLETSFCGPKPIETDPEACAAAVADRILEIVGMGGEGVPLVPVPVTAPISGPASPPMAPVDARDRREVRTEVRVEVSGGAGGAGAARATRQPALALSPVMAPAPKAPDPEKIEKETKNRARNDERKARPRVRREPSEPEVYKSTNKSKDIIRIKLRPDEEEEEEEGGVAARAPNTLALDAPAPAPRGPAPPSPAPSRRRSPSPLGPPSVSRKSSFCSLFKSRETIGSPDSPQAQEALRRKRSLTEGRARSKSRDRSATPTSSKIRGSVLSLFRTPRKSATASSPGSRATSPAPAPAPLYPSAPSDPHRAQQDKLKYYEEAKNGIIHIPLRTPPEERGASASGRRSSGAEAGPSGAAAAPEAPRPASAPQPRCPEGAPPPSRAPPVLRTVLPDGSIIIPLHSPTERVPETEFPPPIRPKDPTPPEAEPEPEPRPISRRDDFEPAQTRAETGESSISSPEAAAVEPAREPRPTEPEPVASPPEQIRPEVSSERRKERFVFTTHVGSRDQVFSTQFSITKTPSITSEISGSFPSFENGELRDSHIASEPGPGARSPADAPPPPRDSSESEPSSEAAPPQAGNDVERRGLVVQESFEEELPYVPTTLPQERSVVVPMVPVRERGGVLVRSVQRPRAAPGPPATPAPRSAPAPTPAAPADKLRIKLPRRPRVSSAPRPTRERTRSGGGGGDSGGENRAKQEWIDFEEVPERRKQPKRIQTLPGGAGGGGAGGGGAGGGDVVFSYVEPEHCRCECHHEDQLPLLQDDMHASRISSSSAECGEGEGEGEGEGAFSADFDLRHDAHAHTSGRGGRRAPP